MLGVLWFSRGETLLLCARAQSLAWTDSELTTIRVGFSFFMRRIIIHSADDDFQFQKTGNSYLRT